MLEPSADYEYEEWEWWEPCLICKLPHPYGKYHEYPWHLTCVYSAAGKKKADEWKREQKKAAKAEIPTLDFPET